ncbi:MAG: phage shock protein E [Cyclobacteriaceae bacterium]|jgi:phage shock protein E
MTDLEKMINDGATVVDVRSPAEFAAASAPGSINIPLNEVPLRIDEIRDLDQLFVVCCQSGGRSGQAEAFLMGNGINCYNAGSWLNVNATLAHKV